MNYYVTLLAWFAPLVFTALIVILLIALRWFTHKERMAKMAQGLPLEETPKSEKHKNLLAIGLILGLLGLALTIGLITLGIGPWLLAGLLPLFAGLALILTSLVLQPPKPKAAKEEPEPPVESLSETSTAATVASTAEVVVEEEPFVDETWDDEPEVEEDENRDEDEFLA